jgi:DNA-binding GntR family transcriptional regulator
VGNGPGDTYVSTTILAACEARDPARAARAIRNHLAQTVAHVTDDLEKVGQRSTG